MKRILVTDSGKGKETIGKKQKVFVKSVGKGTDSVPIRKS